MHDDAILLYEDGGGYAEMSVFAECPLFDREQLKEFPSGSPEPFGRISRSFKNQAVYTHRRISQKYVKF
jgi:hypothetical protein